MIVRNFANRVYDPWSQGMDRRALRADSIKSKLFGGGQQGAMYVPVPFMYGQQVLFQDSTGTTPVTADGQPVGLMLDLSKGLELGPELVTNGGFDSDVEGWLSYSNAVLTNDAGRLLVEDATSVGGAYQDVQVEAGKKYIFECTASGAGFNTIRIYGSAEFALPLLFSESQPGEIKGVFVAASSESRVYLSVDSGAAFFDNISVRELPGNHATQATAAAKSLYKTTGLLQQYDGVDDVTNVTLPAIASATVITAKATGVVVQYPVDLSAGSYTITESHSGIIIRDGQLSASEEQAAVDYLSGMQGVA